MDPAPRYCKAARSVSGPRNPRVPPSFNRDGNLVVWARRAAKLEPAHEMLCAQGDKRLYPDFLQGCLVSEALYGTALRTVERTLSEEQINSMDGIKEIVDLLVRFNSTIGAHKVLAGYKSLLQIRHGQKETF